MHYGYFLNGTVYPIVLYQQIDQGSICRGTGASDRVASFNGHAKWGSNRIMIIMNSPAARAINKYIKLASTATPNLSTPHTGGVPAARARNP